MHVDQTKCSSTIGNYDSSVEQCGPSFKLNQKTTVKKNMQLFSTDCVIPQVGKNNSKYILGQRDRPVQAKHQEEIANE